MTKDEMYDKFKGLVNRSRPNLKAVSPNDFPIHSERNIKILEGLMQEEFYASLMEELAEMAEVAHEQAAVSYRQQSPMLPTYNYGVEDGIRAVQMKFKQLRQAYKGPERN